MKGPKTVYICTECGQKSAKWLGKCPTCGAWNSFEEEIEAEPAKASQRSNAIDALGEAPRSTAGDFLVAETIDVI